MLSSVIRICLYLAFLLSISFLIISYVQFRNRIVDEGIEIPQRYSLFQNYIEPKFLIGYPDNWEVTTNNDASLITFSSKALITLETEGLDSNFTQVKIQKTKINNLYTSLSKNEDCEKFLSDNLENIVDNRLIKINNTPICRTQITVQGLDVFIRYYLPFKNFSVEITVTSKNKESEEYKKAMNIVNSLVFIN